MRNRAEGEEKRRPTNGNHQSHVRARTPVGRGSASPLHIAPTQGHVGAMRNRAEGEESVARPTATANHTYEYASPVGRALTRYEVVAARSVNFA